MAAARLRLAVHLDKSSGNDLLCFAPGRDESGHFQESAERDGRFDADPIRRAGRRCRSAGCHHASR